VRACRILFSPWGPSAARLCDLAYCTRAGIVASKSFVSSSGDANEFAETDTKLVTVAFAGTGADRRRYRRRYRLSTYRCLPPRNVTPLRRLRPRRAIERDLAICFLFTDNTGRLTVRLRESNSAMRSLHGRERERERERERRGGGEREGSLHPAIFLINPSWFLKRESQSKIP